MCSKIRFIPFLLFLLGANATKYTVIPDDEQIFKPCKGEEDNFLTFFFDMSNLTFNFISDEEVLVNGYFKAIADIKANDTLWFTLEMFKEVRGDYIIPMVEIKREDLCKSLFNPVEIWYPYVAKMDKKYHICPNVKGTIYGIPNWSTKENDIRLPDSKLSGAYRTFARAGIVRNPKIFSCLVFDFHLFLSKSS